MSLNRLQYTVIAGWFITLGVVLTARAALGIPTTLVEAVTVIVLGCIPAVVLLAVFHGAGPRNVTQMLHEIDGRAGETVPLRVRAHETGAARRTE